MAADEPIGLETFEFDAGLVVRETPSGRLRRVDGAAVQAWRELARSLPPIEPVELCPPAPPVPDAAPAFDRVVGFDRTGIRLRCWDPLLALTLHGTFGHGPDGLVPTGTLDLHAGGSGVVLARNGRVLGRPDDLWIGRWLMLMRLAVDLHPEQRLWSVLHASAIRLPQGAVVLAANSGSGKTTLAAALLAAGGRLLADDVTPLAAGGVLPMPAAMSLKAGSWPVLAERLPELQAAPPVRIGRERLRYLWPAARIAEPGCHPVAALVMPCYRAGAATTMTPIRPAEALRALTDSGTWPPGDRDGLAAMLAWLGRVPAFALTHGDTDQAVARLTALPDPPLLGPAHAD